MNAEAAVTETERLLTQSALEQAAELEALLKDADRGDANAMYDVAYAIEHGQGATKDRRRASVWYAKAAARSNVRAMNNLGVYYSENGDEVEAARWYLKAAEAGDALAMKNVGWALLDGRGGSKDLWTARAWLERAQDSGLAGANLPLALLLREEDPKGNAFRYGTLFREVAEAGDSPRAAYEWALCLSRGDGVAADLHAAERWMCRAASYGSSKAKAWLQEHSMSWISEWIWIPQVSLGPLTFGESPSHLIDTLGLELNEAFEGDFPGFDGVFDEEHPESRGLESKLYGLQLSREFGLLCDVWSGLGTDLVIRYKDEDLLGAGLEEALTALDVDDWTVDPMGVGEIDLTSDSLGLTLDVSDGRVEHLSVSTAWDSDDAFRIAQDLNTQPPLP